MDLQLKDKVAIVTGGSQGIGRATALRLAAEGASVVIAARGRELLDAVAAEIRAAGGKAAAVQADVSRAEDCAKLVAEALKAYGRLDILVNNAGTSATGEFESASDAIWQADFELKLFAAIRLARLAIPLMKQQGGGRIINITNIGATAARQFDADHGHALRARVHQGAVERVGAASDPGQHRLYRLGARRTT